MKVPNFFSWSSDDQRDRKSTRLNSSHGYISYAVFCLKKKKKNKAIGHPHVPRIVTEHRSTAEYSTASVTPRISLHRPTALRLPLAMKCLTADICHEA